MLIGAWLLAYLTVAFILSAAVVRLTPQSRVARSLRVNLGFFPLLPILLCLTASRAARRAIELSFIGLERLFVRLSGRKQYRRRRYGPYEHPRASVRDPGRNC